MIAESKLVKKGLNLEFTVEIAPGKNKLLFPRKNFNVRDLAQGEGHGCMWN